MPMGFRARRRVRRALLVVIACLYALSIPWYRETGVEPEVWLGLPGWVAVALGCYVAVAILNAVAWWISDIEDTRADTSEEGK